MTINCIANLIALGENKTASIPFYRVVDDIIADVVQFTVVTDDAIVESALPEKPIEIKIAT